MNRSELVIKLDRGTRQLAFGVTEQASDDLSVVTPRAAEIARVINQLASLAYEIESQPARSEPIARTERSREDLLMQLDLVVATSRDCQRVPSDLLGALAREARDVRKSIGG